MAQRYSQPVPRERMLHGLCPECGQPASTHSNDLRFWMPRACDLTQTGVIDRIDQYRSETTDV